MDTHYDISGRVSQIPALLRLAAFLLACCIIASAVLYGYSRFGIQFLQKGQPDWGLLGWVKILAAVTAAGCIYFAFRNTNHKDQALPDRERRFIAAATLFSAFVLLISAVTVLVIPTILNETVREGQFVGVLTDLVLLVALAFFGMCVARSRHVAGFRILGYPPVFAFAIMFAAAFLILMEEMSWGQHLLGWEAGELFAGNAQNETNFHNFATHRFEAAYYSAAFVVFIALPVFWTSSNNTLLESFTPFIPPRSFALLALPIAGLVYEAWNIIIYQLWFFLGAMIALQLVREGRTAGGSFHPAAMLALFIVSQCVFLLFGSGMVDGYELSEIREFVIAFAIACYSVLMYWRLRQAPA